MPRTRETDRRWLEKHGNKWRVTVAVPRDLHAVLGTRLKTTLSTDSLAVANTLKLRAVDKLQAQIAQARQNHAGKPKAIVREGLNIAALAEEAVDIAACGKKEEHPNAQRQIAGFITERATDILGPEVGYRNMIDEDGNEDIEPVFDPRRAKLAKDFIDAANGIAFPLAAMHQQYLNSATVKRRTKADDVRALRYLTTWCERECIPVTVQAITPRVAIRFRKALKDLTGGLHEVTQNKYISRLSVYWKYLIEEDHAETNPFAGVKVKVRDTPYNEKERAFTDTEVQRLLMGSAEPRLMDLMMIAALTGARIDAIVDMKVKDAVDGAFTFKPQKKEASSRDVPIHPALAAIVARRTDGRTPDDDLFPDWPAPPPDTHRERSFKASNGFTKHRRELGVDEVVEGKRRALVNFHSFRRWFITKADRTGQPDRLIKAMVGHDGLGMTFGRYSEGSEWRAAKRLIGKIRLPPLDGTPVVEERSVRR